MHPDSNGPFIAAIDIGSSSVRALLFDGKARQVEHSGSQIAYQIETSPDGGAEIDPDKLMAITVNCVDRLHAQVREAGIRVSAVASTGFWHSFCGVDGDGKPALPIMHLLDTRSAEFVSQVPDAHRRTGCVPHTSYWPAKLLWLERNRNTEFRAIRQWLSFPEYFFLKIFCQPVASTSMLSGTGLWSLSANDYDAETLAALPIHRDQLAPPDSLDQSLYRLNAEYRARWPAFDSIAWFPAIGDGAANHIGSGCVRSGQFSLMVGTTGAIRALTATLDGGIPAGLWCYRVDRNRLLMGGALSNGGNVLAWLKHALALPADLEAELEKAVPGNHGLVVLPFLAGERSPYWRGDLRCMIAGLSLATNSLDIAQATLEAVTLRFRAVYRLLADSLGVPEELIASGGGLLHSRAWSQMMADALEHTIVVPRALEASSRGTALLALERLGAISSLSAAPQLSSDIFAPRAENATRLRALGTEQERLYELFFGEQRQAAKL